MTDYQSSSIVAQRLLDHFKSTFLAGLASGNENVMVALARAHCGPPTGERPPTLHFKLGSLFDALCISVKLHGEPPLVIRDWKKCFTKFRAALMHPWPDDEIDRAGYRVDLSHRSRSSVNDEYTLTPKQKLARQESTESEERRNSGHFGV